MRLRTPLLAGALAGPDHGGRQIVLFHRLAGADRFTPISTTTTNGLGEYEFTRAEGVVLTNRSWFVREAGPGANPFTHSRTIHERVASLVSLAASSSSGVTGHPLVFSGHVTPDHPGSRVLLQQQRGTSDDWTTIGRGQVGPDSDYVISHAWRTPGAHNVRVLIGRDARNIAALSDPVSIVAQQNQISGFSIQSSAPIITDGQTATISGVLDQPQSTTPQGGATVVLAGTAPGSGRPLHVLQTTTTGADGTYSFTVAPTTNEIYAVRTASAPVRRSAQLFQGVHLGADHDWHTVAVSRVRPGSRFAFGWTFGTAQTKQFRARITGGDVNVGGASAPVTVDVSPASLGGRPQS